MTTPKWSVPYLSYSLLRDGAAPPGRRGHAAEDMVRPEGANAPPDVRRLDGFGRACG